VSGERMTEDAAAAPAPALGATPGSEHLSALREAYLRLLAGERGLDFLRLDSPEALAAALTAPALAKPTQVRADGRVAFAALAILLLVWRHAEPLARWARQLQRTAP
jgi:mxaL protein